ncbi:MAG: hydroxymethylglutaryl-CoA reductase, degradative [Dermatophilaceae bacterium]
MDSRMPGFYKLSVTERLQALVDRGLLGADDYRTLTNGGNTIDVARADKMIENVIGVLGLPVGLGLNFLINDKDYVVPLVVEEPSIVAALSSAAKLVRSAGGFTASSTEPILIGQIQIVDVPNSARAQAVLLQRKGEILALANSLHPKMVARGGGAQDLEVVIHPSPQGGHDMVLVHLLVNTCDAMGANLVNTMCEGVASLVETISGGTVLLRILSNLTDRALARAEMVVPTALLAGKGYTGERVRDEIIRANDLAIVDPYRAATHNKGIMNGVDAVALATGNDWRALEAAAHAYAARGTAYSSLTSWTKNDAGDLVGSIEMPMKVGTVGGPLQNNPTVAMNHRILGVSSARELAEVMGAVGLAQNFSALRALVTDGIQQGHMTLHARTVAAAAGAGADVFDTVIERLLDDGEIKVWKAKEILAELEQEKASGATELGTAAYGMAGAGQAEHGATGGKHVTEDDYVAGHGKVILLGEHAVVYGRRAIAAPVPLAIRARVEDGDNGIDLIIPRWGVELHVEPGSEYSGGFLKSLSPIIDKLDIGDRSMRIFVQPGIPRAMGLGGSAALAVALIRAVDRHCSLGLSDAEVSALSYECEMVAHGTASGIDNTVATYGYPLLYQRGEPPIIEPLQLSQPVPLVVAMTGVESLTAATVGRVRDAWKRHPALYERIFDSIDDLTMQGAEALRTNDLHQLGELMNICQGQLNALQVSSEQLEELVQIARHNGAAGAKLTGGGGGGSIVAVCPDGGAQVVAAMQEAGYRAMEVTLG